MPEFQRINCNLAIFLAECCKQTYNQYRNNGHFEVPKGYRLVEGFSAMSAAGVTEWFGYIIQSRNNIVLAFRGTQSINDWISDVEVGQTPYPYALLAGNTHSGFTSIYMSCRDEIHRVLRDLHPQKKLYITGHSLGGALAVLAALDIATNTRFRRPVMYNFGGPRVGDPRFTTSYHRWVKASLRVINKFDLVPKVPPTFIRFPIKKNVLYYRHVPKQFTISLMAGGIQSNHNIRTYIAALKML